MRSCSREVTRRPPSFSTTYPEFARWPSTLPSRQWHSIASAPRPAAEKPTMSLHVSNSASSLVPPGRGGRREPASKSRA